VGIAEGEDSDRVDFLVDGERIIDNFFVIRAVVKRNIRRAEAGYSHLNPDQKNVLFLLDELTFPLAGGGQKNDMGVVYFFLIIKASSGASEPVAGYFGFGSVGVEDPKVDKSFGLVFDRNEKKAVSSDPCMAVTDPQGQAPDLRDSFGFFLVDNQKVVAQGMDFKKFHLKEP
jgi:hypothetical protein